MEMDARREIVDARLEHRRMEREIATKAKSAKDNVEEKVELFHKELDPQIVEVEKLMEDCGGDEVSSQLDTIATKLTKVQKYITDASIFLPGYDLKISQTKYNGLMMKFQETQDKVQPKKKFGFKNKKKNPAVKKESVITAKGDLEEADICAKDTVLGVNIEDITKIENLLTVKNRLDETLVVQGEEVSGRDVSLTGLVNCRVEVRGAPSTLHMTDISKCIILCGPVATSVFVEGCKDSTLAVSCQQLRTHEARRCKIYLHTTSRAIIEDCSEVEFAPYTWNYPSIDTDYKAAGLDRTINNWEQVGDFNWLASDTPSPNWSMIPAEKRITSWEEVHPGN